MFLQANGYDYNEAFLLTLTFLGVLYVFIYEMFRKNDNPFENIAITLLGIIYIAVPISLFWPIAYRENIYQYNSSLIFGFFIIIWTYDSFAYLSGMKFGKRKLFERISPKKSWEGAIGGYIFALLAAYILSTIFDDLTLVQWLVTASLIAIFGTLGDLAESMLKRSLNIKDSSNFLPGHGGLLDRFDALFLAVPALYLYYQFI
jgi:phosphatidate cytidylyltransferase